jgi:aspartyl-tRNA(Asn)/glutamyl-tRNA(Gln) amidotransferase subunit A
LNPLDLVDMDAVAVARAVRSKELSPVEVVQASPAHMDALEPRLHAFCTPTPALALEQARALEKAILAGEEVGPLVGVPLGVKDLICTAGIRTVSGSYAYQHFVPDEDDIVVERLKAAGVVILGKTNVPEFGYSGVGHNPVFETTRNPWNTDLTPGGSSAGSGAAVVSRMCPVALGSDGGGVAPIKSNRPRLVVRG